MNLNDSNTASVRTTWVVGVIAFLSWLGSRIFDTEISTDDPWLILLAPAVVGIFHRGFLVLSETVPYFGYVLFGINRSPEYSTPPPALPALADEDRGFVESTLIWAIVGILAIVALVIWILANI